MAEHDTRQQAGSAGPEGQAGAGPEGQAGTGPEGPTGPGPEGPTGTGPEGSAGAGHEGPTGPVIRDKRRVDPATGRIREPGGTGSAPVPGLSGQEAGPAAFGPDKSADTPADTPAGTSADTSADTSAGTSAGTSGGTSAGSDHPDTVLAEERLRDLQRLQAEYVNYKRRVDRDRELHRDVAVGRVVEALLPVLDDVHLARQHGDVVDGTPFAAIADKLDATLAKFGVERFGQPGETFDPVHHEALMHVEAELADGTEETTVVQVLQPGYKMNDRVIRAARVAVADPP